MLQAACDLHSGEIEVNNELVKDGNQGETYKVNAALHGEFVFHHDGHFDEDEIKDVSACAGFSEDPPEPIRLDVMKRVSEA